jgi:hypothetical protein
MTPIETAARAKYEAWRKRSGCELPWEDCHPLTKMEIVSDMRLSLIALSEVKLPRDVIEAGALAGGIGTEWIVGDVVRAVLRAIAEGEA